MSVGTDCLVPPSAECSQRALELALRLLRNPAQTPLVVDDVLAELGRCFQAAGVGLSSIPGGTVAVHGLVDWFPPQQSEALEAFRAAPAALTLVAPLGASVLATAVDSAQGSWLLWLEGSGPWAEGDAAALTLVSQALARRAADFTTEGTWARRRQCQLRQRRLEEAALVVRRLAHDFGNVLTGILGFAELTLARPEADSTARQHVAEIHLAAQQGANWVHQLRLFSRRGAGRSGAVSLLPALADEAARLRQPDGSIPLRLAVADDLPPIALDAEALHQVLGRLLDNAHEAHAEKGLITVTASPVTLTETDCLDYFGSPSPGPAIEVTIADTGPGLSPEVRRNMFAEPFFSTKPRHRGLGLAVVYGVLQAYRGGARVEEGPDQRGTLVRVVLPQAAPAPVSVVRRPAAVPGHGEKVLVVDDDPLILNLVCTTLERAGYRAHPAGSAAEALASYSAARTEPYGLVLSDVLMPQMTGVDLVRCLLNQDARVNVLFMSGHVSEDFAQHNLEGWHFDLLPKPFRPDGLLRAVRAALDRGPRRAHDEVPRA